MNHNVEQAFEWRVEEGGSESSCPVLIPLSPLPLNKAGTGGVHTCIKSLRMNLKSGFQNAICKACRECTYLHVNCKSVYARLLICPQLLKAWTLKAVCRSFESGAY